MEVKREETKFVSPIQSDRHERLNMLSHEHILRTKHFDKMREGIPEEIEKINKKIRRTGDTLAVLMEGRKTMNKKEIKKHPSSLEVIEQELWGMREKKRTLEKRLEKINKEEYLLTTNPLAMGSIIALNEKYGIEHEDLNSFTKLISDSNMDIKEKKSLVKKYKKLFHDQNKFILKGNVHQILLELHNQWAEIKQKARR